MISLNRHEIFILRDLIMDELAYLRFDIQKRMIIEISNDIFDIRSQISYLIYKEA